MRYSTSALALAASASAQYSSDLLPSNPGGAIPAGIQAPSTSGFQNATIQPARGGLAVCSSGYVDVQATTSKNLKLNFELPTNQSQVTETFLKMITSGSSFAQELVGGMQSVNGTYKIAATLCTPANNTQPDQVQILTHGIGFDRYYWDFAPGYSWVDVAAQYDHATFFYDRLGVGKSEKADALNVVQAPLEVEIAHQLIGKLRAGQFGNFSKVVGVGHSFGSIITQAITSQYPSDLDAAVLTGFSANSSALPVFITGLNLALAMPNAPYRFATIPQGYLVSDTAISNQIGFLKAPGFDPEIANLAEATKGTVTFGELFSQSAPTMPAMNYTGPVAVVNGANDLPFCFGNCSYPTNLALGALNKLYPMTNKTGAYLARDAGHGVNLHYSAVAAYHFAQDFVNSYIM
ncbi:Putative alpha/beta hydrolase-1 [Septoria linicola]|uniref:Alpha/beta hydrolase-1 n=1 Tax=Septoria linicola TaxID=215465 RepID=A0A9Q9B386_9PEZI|nr:Putative alpha/beta hydrolase-1 [Septoria linicola]